MSKNPTATRFLRIGEFLAVCALAGGCRATEQLEFPAAFLAGASAVEITPELERFEDRDGDGRRGKDEPFEDRNGNGKWDPVWMAGFDLNRPALDVHDPLWARALALRFGNRTVLLIACDLIGVLHHRARQIRNRIGRELGIPESHVILHSTHNHSGPDTLGLWGPLPLATGLSPDYLSRLENHCVEAARRAIESLRPARMACGHVRVPGWFRDSRKPVFIDERVGWMLFRGTDEKPIAIAAFAGCHPEGIGRKNRHLTSDFPHFFRRSLEKEFPGAVALFVASDLGALISPALKKKGWEGIEEMGRALAEALLPALRTADPQEPGRLVLRSAEFEFPMDNPWFRAGIQAGTFGPVHEGLRKEGDRYFLRSSVTAVRIGSALLVTVPGELAPELGQEISSMVPHHPVFLIGLGNDEVGYILRKEDWDPKQYEEKMSLGPETAPKLMEELRNLLAAMAGP